MIMIQPHILQSHEILHEMKKNKPLECVVVESRFAGETPKDLLVNKKFTLACMRDCIKRGEAPYASHVIYAHSYIVDDFVAQERALGIYAGFIWGDFAGKTVVYTDLGISSGMQEGIDHAHSKKRPIEFRHLGFIPQISEEEVQQEILYCKNQLNFLEEIKKIGLSTTVAISTDNLIKKVA